ncbi:MAG TPA: hypothetical protein VGO82_03375, partial [Enterovirga sp.]|nr:hypothetical protein [Enterovirga sp.]
ARALSPDTATSSLGERLGLGEVDEDELYAALDWLHERQPEPPRVCRRLSPLRRWSHDEEEFEPLFP